jgi:hypothetical protein
MQSHFRSAIHPGTLAPLPLQQGHTKGKCAEFLKVQGMAGQRLIFQNTAHLNQLGESVLVKELTRPWRGKGIKVRREHLRKEALLLPHHSAQGCQNPRAIPCKQACTSVPAAMMSQNCPQRDHVIVHAGTLAESPKPSASTATN